ncbi:hypothetical protein C7B82_29425 [Stenomitos frigidus ULC18]|uniref:Uncharacterized protein n=2 Tax=Stenomitos TaxID=1844270 RepID=A0A2T1DTZ5_9CYAN|nr:hypothetical protein C7B82_29425 [Stenomitos frigidus ULC18]
MRVDKANGGLTVSGDLYRFRFFIPIPLPIPSLPIPIPDPRLPQLPGSTTPAIASMDTADATEIPIHPRNRYHSYLKVTNVQFSPVITTAHCHLTLTIDEYRYTQPPAGSFDGSFPTTPSRTVTAVLSPKASPVGLSGPYFEGKLYETGVEKGTFSMSWVSPFFRRATVEVDTLTGSVAPQAVPATSGSGTEDFKTVFATAGWDLNVIYDQTSIPVPAGVTATNCWSSADLHALMLSVRNPATNLDRDWRMHLLVVPAHLGCGRGVMYDTIEVPREGVASFSDDGYPDSDSSNFGTATNQKQRDVARAFLRSACHEVGHGFNQQHQEITLFGEPGADNSIMTTSPSVADVLGGATTGDPSVFPDNIALRFNAHVRHHLIHFPDPVVRPGGMTFGTGHSSTVPEVDVDRYFYRSEVLELKLVVKKQRVKLGEPLPLSWELVNNTKEAIATPSDISIEAQHAEITVIKTDGSAKRMSSFVIQTDKGSIKDLKPGKKRKAETTLFWSSKGFAFTEPGKHTIAVKIRWNQAGIPCGVQSNLELWVDYPTSEADNEVAATLLDQEVGKFVALGGNAKHLKAGVSRVEEAIAQHGNHPASKAMMAYGGHKYSKLSE